VNNRVLFLCLVLFRVGSIAAVTQAEKDLSSLLGDLARPGKTTLAAAVLLELAKAQPSVRNELSNALPNLLSTSTDIEVLRSEATLAGRLGLASAVPALVQLLDRPAGPDWEAVLSTFTSFAELRDDPIARALADIGAPAVQALSTPLESVHVRTRERAARILICINTPGSFSVLRHHVGREADRSLKRYISANLARAKYPGH
jgi:hypothetical protein